ncbi:hypothetical protein PoB_003705000 [Plakobranchus ocellatus]|uniref:DDE Tnp4 domain-containing protein n=1 Tax=Plakobranchus ocellatus TaxID=259542 RepID=A0AAV4AUH7_9GAST|nr:hypothetical protein PoB_003705000 [Plakobranchus ocellatus]
MLPKPSPGILIEKKLMLPKPAPSTLMEKKLMLPKSAPGTLIEKKLMSPKPAPGTLIEKKLMLPKHAPLPQSNIVAPPVFVADDAYPLLPFLMKPHSGSSLPLAQDRFNKRLSRCRKVVECAFGILN